MVRFDNCKIIGRGNGLPEDSNNFDFWSSPDLFNWVPPELQLVVQLGPSLPISDSSPQPRPPYDDHMIIVCSFYAHLGWSSYDCHTMISLPLRRSRPPALQGPTGLPVNWSPTPPVNWSPSQWSALRPHLLPDRPPGPYWPHPPLALPPPQRAPSLPLVEPGRPHLLLAGTIEEEALGKGQS